MSSEQFSGHRVKNKSLLQIFGYCFSDSCSMKSSLEDGSVRTDEHHMRNALDSVEYGNNLFSPSGSSDISYYSSNSKTTLRSCDLSNTMSSDVDLVIVPTFVST